MKHYSQHPRIKRIRRQQAIERLTAYILLVTFLLLAFYGLYKLTEPSNRNYNAYMCAQYGKAEDCKTPLTKSEQLQRIIKYQRGEVIYSER